MFDTTKTLTFPFGHPAEGEDVLWRVVAQRYALMPFDYEDDWSVSAPRLEALWFPVVRRTPKGAWIDHGHSVTGDTRFVRLVTDGKRFACNTVEEAVAGFVVRRRNQIRILEAQLVRARADLALVVPPAPRPVKEKTA